MRPTSEATTLSPTSEAAVLDPTSKWGGAEQSERWGRGSGASGGGGEGERSELAAGGLASKATELVHNRRKIIIYGIHVQLLT